MVFCWGGSKAFRYATYNSTVSEAFVFYGTAPKDGQLLNNIECPVYGLYGENDQRVNATIEETQKLMKANTKGSYKIVMYPGAGHAFMRRGDDPNENDANKMARNAAWQRVIAILELN